MATKNEGVKIHSRHIFYQYFSCSSAMLATTTSGVHYGWPSPSLPILLAPDSPIPITGNEGYWLATMPLFGALLGAVTSPILNNNIGRHKTILMTSLPYLVAWFMIYFSTTVPLLIVARFIAGIGDGWCFSSVPIYTGEVSDPKKRGMFGSWTAVSFIFGILIANAVGSYLSIKNAAVVLSILPIALIICFIRMPESPYFHISKGNLEATKRSLEKFRGPEEADTELTRMYEAVTADLQKSKSNPFQLFTVERNRRALYVMLICRGTQQFSGYSAIVFYAQIIFQEASVTISAELSSIIFFLTQVIVTILASTIVDRAGRRPLLMLSVTGAGLSLLVEGIYFYIKTRTDIDCSSVSVLPLVALVCYNIFFSIGLHSIPIVVISEVFHPDIKAVGLGFADIYFSVVAAATSKFFQITRDNFGICVPFISFAAICAVALAIIAVYVPETKGKTLEEIQDYFKRVKHNKPDHVDT